MSYKYTFYFFTCYHCSAIYYSVYKIKSKKCLSCKRTFQFKNSNKTKLKLTIQEAIKLLQYLKKKKIESESFDFKEEIELLRK